MKECSVCHKVCNESDFYAPRYGHCKQCQNIKRKNCPSYNLNHKPVRKVFDIDRIVRMLETGFLPITKVIEVNDMSNCTFYHYVNDGKITYKKPLKKYKFIPFINIIPLNYPDVEQYRFIPLIDVLPLDYF